MQLGGRIRWRNGERLWTQVPRRIRVLPSFEIIIKSLSRKLAGGQRPVDIADSPERGRKRDAREGKNERQDSGRNSNKLL